MRRGKQLLQAGIAISAVAFGAAGAAAQTFNSPVQGNVGLSTQITADSNKSLSPTPLGATVTATERLTFGFLSSTRTQQFQISGSTALTFNTLPGGGTNLSAQRPNLQFSYARQAARSNLKVTARHDQQDVTNVYDSDPTDVVNIIVDTGTVTRTGATASYRTGVGGPLDLSFSAAFDRRDYAGTTSPQLFDTNTATLSATANMKLSGATTGNLTIKNTRYSAADFLSTKRNTTTYSLGVTSQVSSGLTVNGSIGYQTKTTKAGGPATTQSGPRASAKITKSLPDGSIFGSIQYDATGSSNKAVLSIGRTMDLPDGTLSASVTANSVIGGSTQVLGNLKYSKQLPSGSLDVALNQSLSTNNINQDIRYTNLGIGFSKQISSTDGINLSLGLSRSEDAGAGSAPTISRATVTAAYSRALTSDWNMQVGYRHRSYAQTGTPSAASDALFLTLTRNIQFGF